MRRRSLISLLVVLATFSGPSVASAEGLLTVTLEGETTVELQSSITFSGQVQLGDVPVPMQDVILIVNGAPEDSDTTDVNGAFEIDHPFSSAGHYEVEAVAARGTLLESSSDRRVVTAGYFPLTVTKAGTGAGTVTSSPAGIACGSDCTERFAYDTDVTLSAVAAGGSTFNGWSVAGCAGLGSCTLEMTAARDVVATFTDIAAPTAPVLTSTTPASPADDDTPVVNGTAEAGTSVRVYTSAGCSGAPVGTGVAAGGVFAIEVGVASDATSNLRATATDAAGNVSGCSSSLAYTEDSTAPGRPVVTGVAPGPVANDNTPTIMGTTEPSATVRLFTNAACSGTAAATGTAPAGAFSIDATVANDSTTTFYATATDRAGHLSACSTTSVTFTEDSTAPARPVLTGTTPGAPANNNTPTVNGTAEAGATVRVYRTSDCTGTVAGTGTATGGTFSISVSVADDSTTTYRAMATDASGNQGGCSNNSVTYVEDSLAPAAPSITGSNPTSPSSSNTPSIVGTAEAGSTVRLYANGACTGTVAGSGTASGIGAFSITVNVPADAATTFSATASDAAINLSGCSTPFTYTEDSVAPAAPVLAGTTPASMANNNTPVINGTAENGATVRLYTSGDCSGAPVASGTAAGGSFSIGVTVPNDSTTTFRGTATDAAGNTGACSAPLTYVEDSTAPVAPTLEGTNPVSPASDNDPAVFGSAENGSTVRLYLGSSCTGTPAGTQVASGGSFSIDVTVPADATTTIRATATDAAGNTGPCATGLTYVEDSTAPTVPSLNATTPASPANENEPVVTGSAENGALVSLYATSACSGDPLASGVATSSGFSVSIAVDDDSTSQIRATARDAAGNTSACSSPRTYVEDSTPPAAPVISTSSPVSPSSSNTPSISGTADSSSLLRLYLTADCTGAIAASETTDGTFTLPVTVPSDATTSITARATDAAGNVSACSTVLTYVEDSTAPAAPVFGGITPQSPANHNSPTITGTAEDGVTVRLYSGAGCTGTVLASAPAAGGTFTLGVTVTDNTTSSFRASATDAAGNVSGCGGPLNYVEDSSAPGAPNLTSVTPASPANHNAPTVNGSAEFQAIVRLHQTSDCSGEPLATTTVQGPGSFALAVSVADDTTTSFRATATDAAGNRSACSAAISYIEDSTGPGAPSLSTFTPASGSNENQPVLSGTGENGTTVRIYHLAACAGAVVDTYPMSSTTFATRMSVDDNTTTTFSADAVDAAGNAGGCSNALTYVENSGGLGVPVFTGIVPGLTGNDNAPRLNGNAPSASTVKIYRSSTCGGAVAAQATAAGGTFQIPVTVADNSTTTFTATSTASSTTSPCSDPITYTEDSVAPGVPALTGVTPASGADENAPTITGTAETGATVSLYTTTDCTGTIAGTDVASDGTFSIQVTVPDNTSTNFRGMARDAAGNTSACSGSLNYVENSVQTAAPVLSSTNPVSPANRNDPTVSGTAPSGAVVRLFSTADCSGAVLATVAASGTSFSAPISVADDTTTALRGTATVDGRTSPCSAPLSYVEDSTAPVMGAATVELRQTSYQSPSFDLTWSPAQDAVSPSSAIVYRACMTLTSGACDTGNGTYPAGPDGAYVAGGTWGARHFFTAVATDEAGNAAVGPEVEFLSPTRENVVQVASGYAFTCALLRDGRVACGGRDDEGQLGDGGGSTTDSMEPVPGVADAIAVTAGTEYACALRRGGTVACWGANDSGQIGDGTRTNALTPKTVTGLVGATQISAGTAHTCARLASGQLKCWGENANSQLGDGTTTDRLSPVTVSGISNAVHVTVGMEFTCAGNSAGRVLCWGDGQYGQMGAGSVPDTNPTPITVPFVQNVLTVDAGLRHACAIVADGRVYCWGANYYGQLGNGTTTGSDIAVVVPELSPVSTLSIAAGLSCATDPGGEVYCWGANDSSSYGPSPRHLSEWDGMVSVSVSNYQICVLDGRGVARCWGGGYYDITPWDPYSLRLHTVLGDPVASQVSAGGTHTCALGGSRLDCWGDNSQGQLSTGDTASSRTPVNSDGGVAALATGNAHTCVSNAYRGTGCWGDNSAKQTGSSGSSDVLTDNDVDDVDGPRALAAGVAHSCAIVADGSARCWGSNGSGRLGDGSSVTESATPVTVSGLTNAIAITAGYAHTCALRGTGVVMCWGSNTYGQLGDGTTTTRATPVQVSGLTDVVAISAGNYHTCAQRSDGSVQCWGAGTSGQLGNSSLANRTTPVSAGIGDVIGLDAGGNTTCVVRVGGTARCWGANAYGQVGDGTTTNRSVNVAVSGMTDATSIDVGNAHACAVRIGGTLWCWGNNAYGRLGDGTTTHRSTPVAVSRYPG